MNILLFLVPIILYLAGWLVEFYRYWTGSLERQFWGHGLLAFGWGAHGILLVLMLLGEDTGVSLVLTAVAWLAILVYYGLMLKIRSAVFPYIFPPLSVALLITAFFGAGGGSAINPGQGLGWTSNPNLLAAHIVSVLSGILLFGLACIASIVYLYEEHQIKAKATGLISLRLPSLSLLEKYNRVGITLGFFFLTVGLLLGLVAAGVETFSSRLFTPRQMIPIFNWLVYAAFLIIYDLQGRRGRFGAILSIFGFCVVVVSLVSEIISLSQPD